MLQTPRLILRRWRDSDREPFRKLNADPRVMEFYPSVLSAEESDLIIERAEAHFEKHGFGLFATELGKTCIGFVGLQQVPFEAAFTPAVEIGWRISQEHWNQGYATEAALEVLRHAFRDLKMNEIIAMTYKQNLRSRRVMEKIGMSHDPMDDFLNPHPKVKGSWLEEHVLYRIRSSQPLA